MSEVVTESYKKCALVNGILKIEPLMKAMDDFNVILIKSGVCSCDASVGVKRVARVLFPY